MRMNKTKLTALPNVQPIAPFRPEENNFYNVPNSTASNLILEVMGAGDSIADLPARKRQINHNTAIEVLEDGRKRQISLVNEKAQVTIELADIDKLAGSNKPAKKLFVLALIKANEQAIYNGQLTKDYISFPLQELVDIGFYKSLRSARTGFNSGMDTLTSLKVKGQIQQTKKRESSIAALEVLFTGARIEKGQCTVFFNNRINWSFIAQYFTILPRYYFKLSNRASDLLYYIFFLARQHTRDIETQGYFTISFRAIQHRLQLPSEKGLNNPLRDIREPIENAIEQIEIEHSGLYHNMEFALLPVYDDAAPIADYLDNGYLKVSLSGAFATTFIAISKETAKQIETAQKRRERIAEKAIAINTAKSLRKEAGKMRRVDRLLLKIQEAQRLDEMQLAVALIGKRIESGKWKVYADLWDGKFGGKTERLTMEFDTLEEAQKAVAEVEAVHTPTGKRISSASGAVCIIDDIAWAE